MAREPTRAIFSSEMLTSNTESLRIWTCVSVRLDFLVRLHSVNQWIYSDLDYNSIGLTLIHSIPIQMIDNFELSFVVELSKKEQQQINISMWEQVNKYQCENL
jgi:hypothetical protein